VVTRSVRINERTHAADTHNIFADTVRRQWQRNATSVFRILIKLTTGN